jgi:aminopeptidase N
MRHLLSLSCLTLALGALLPALTLPAADAAPEDVRIHHEIFVRLEPAAHEIEVKDTLFFSPGWEELREAGQAHLRFRLHAGLRVTAAAESNFDVRPLPDPAHAGASGSGEEGENHRLRVKTYELIARPGAPEKGIKAVLELKGTIHHPLVAEGVEYARSFSRTPGTIEERGVFLSGASWWLPRLGEELVTFDLTVDLPEAWDAVSQGKRTAHGITKGRRIVRWDCPHEMDEVYICANRFTEYSRSTGSFMAYAFLREPDENLANKYLEVTAQYVDMYRRLLGPYPFSKFALIENFWDTGYGMPSFTLLGPKVIRFPFILHSSYPHEILHNWWGNSVYVDWETGNWCEGLTAYLADHLVREGQGRGAEYRMDTLKNYRNYVDEGKDFPLTGFRSRHSAATQAVGYGKCLMLFHMLRRRLGDALFAKGLQRFYRTNRFKRASWADVRQAFEDVSEQDLTAWFAQWVERTGAPELKATVTATRAKGDDPLSQPTTWVQLEQVQPGPAYDLHVPVAVTYADGSPASVQVLHMTEKTLRQGVPNPTGQRAARVDVDPEFDVFRRLDRAEIPPTLSEMFGATTVTIVVPSKEQDPLAEQWRAFAEGWARGRGDSVQVVEADALPALPTDRTVWVLGTDNPHARLFHESLPGRAAGLDGGHLRFGLEGVPQAGHSFVYVLRHPEQPDLSIGWVGADTEAALPGLSRKLPHYGKYSYLAFMGENPDNVVKGRWEATDSPLVTLLDRGLIARAALEARQHLERLAPVFDPARLQAHVEWLADDAREGRGVGTKGLEESADYIAAAFKAAGLKPGGDDGTFFQHFTVGNGPEGTPVTLKNVVGVLPGTNDAMKGQSAVLGAHYDHLGRGWPDVREGEAGKIHNGADDNASGVAVLLELAQLLGSTLKPERSVVFAAFSGEEWGLKGSAHYVSQDGDLPAKRAIAMVNLDTVGRLDGKKILVLGSGTASEWRHIAMGVGFTTGVESTCVANDPGGSDQKSFHRVGVPAVQIFSGGHADYHRSTDDVDKIDLDGMVRVATFVRETMVYLSQRPEPMTSSLGEAKAPAAGGPAAGPAAGSRRVSLGSMPAFDFPGPGVKVAAVTEGSGAAAAGIEVGDILLAIDGTPLKDLRAFSNVLKAHTPGDEVSVVYRRGEEERTAKVTLQAR